MHIGACNTLENSFKMFISCSFIYKAEVISEPVQNEDKKPNKGPLMNEVACDNELVFEQWENEALDSVIGSS